jgi:hypothetical protein
VHLHNEYAQLSHSLSSRFAMSNRFGSGSYANVQEDYTKPCGRLRNHLLIVVSPSFNKDLSLESSGQKH